MDPFFGGRHGSGPSPREESSPHSAASQYRNFNSASGLDRLLHSPQDMTGLHRYGSKGMDGYNPSGMKRDEGKAFEGFQYGQSQASSSHQTSAVPVQSGKRGSKACVACGFLLLLMCMASRADVQVVRAKIDAREIHQVRMDRADDAFSTTFLAYTKRPEIGAKAGRARADPRRSLVKPKEEYPSSRTRSGI
jgi:hypothetical protein